MVQSISYTLLSNNTVNKYEAQIYSAYGGDITSNVTCVILGNRTVYKHLNETFEVYLYFIDDNDNLMKSVKEFDLLVNNTKISYAFNGYVLRFIWPISLQMNWNHIL